MSMNHIGTNTNGRKSPAQSGPLMNGLASGYQQTDLGLSFITSTMALSANKLLKLAQQHKQYCLTPINPMQGTKRKHLDGSAALERMSPSTKDTHFNINNNNSQSVNNLNLDTKSTQSLDEESCYLSKNLISKDVSNCGSLTLKSERTSPINFNSGKTSGDGRAVTINSMGRSRSSTPSSSSIAALAFNSPSNIANNKNGTLGLNSNGNSNGTGQRSSSNNNGSGELSLSRHLSNHKHQQQVGTQSPEGRIPTENYQQSVEPRNYSNMIRSLAAKYNTTNE